MESATRGAINQGLVACTAGVSSFGLFVSTVYDVGNTQRDRPYVGSCMAQANATSSGLDSMALVRTALGHDAVTAMVLNVQN